MRIGIMCLASFGGSARIATQLAVQLSKGGHKVHIFSRTAPFGDTFDINGIRLHTVKTNREANLHMARLHIDWTDRDLELYLDQILNVIACEGLDILHFHYAIPFAFVAAEIKRRLGKDAPQMIGTLHGTDVSIYGKDSERGPELAQTLYQIDQLTTVSKSHANLAVEVFGLPSRPKVIPNFVDLSIFHPDPAVIGSSLPAGGLRKQNGEKPVIAHLSNFRPVKNPRSMARIFLGIREQIEAELWLIGDGPELDSVKSLLQKSRFAKDVRYWGLHLNVASMLAKTDLLLMTSLAESFCLAALEAMACGVPVLSTDVGGIGEVVQHGKTGFLFPIEDHDLAVRRAVDLIGNTTRHAAMSQAAAKRANCFGIDKIVPVYESLYARMLLQKSTKRQPILATSASNQQSWVFGKNF